MVLPSAVACPAELLALRETGRVQVTDHQGWALAAAGVLLLERVVRLLPRRVVDGCAVWLGLLTWHILRLRRRVVMANLRLAYPEWTESTRSRVGRASFISFMRTTFEFLDAERVLARARIERIGEDILDRAITRGDGVYILCCHLGNWELMCHYGSERFRSVHVVVKPIGKGRLAQTVETMRRRRGMSVISRDSDRKATLAIFRALKEGQLVGFMADQRRARGCVAPFFGRDCYTNTSLLQLWMRRRAPIVPVSLTRTGFDSFRFVVGPELIPDAVGEDDIDLASAAAAMNRVIEGMVDMRPEQYFWMHRRWKGFENA